MENLIELRHVTFSYPDRSPEKTTRPGTPVISDLNLSIPKGSFTVLTGKIGSGKSTLLRLLNGLLLPCQGNVFIEGMDTKNFANLQKIREKIGILFQNPAQQLIFSTVEEDIAFGLENLRLDSQEIAQRITQILGQLNIEKLRKRDPNSLSGGEKQKAALAGLLAMQPECLILDEPTSMLDPNNRLELLTLLKQLQKEGITILCITHSLEEVLTADRILFFQKGKILLDLSPTELGKHIPEIREMGIAVPYIIDAVNHLHNRYLPDLPCNILSETELLDKLASAQLKQKTVPTISLSPVSSTLSEYDIGKEGKLIEVNHVSFTYERRKNAPKILENLSFSIRKGETVGILGPCGSGKSTLLLLLSGLLSPSTGTITICQYSTKEKRFREIRKKIGLVFQNPEDQLFEENVGKEIAFAPSNQGCSQRETEIRVQEAMALVELAPELKGVSPFALSGGEKRKVALASIFAMEPEILLLDEPTANLDFEGTELILALLKRWKSKHNGTIIFISHDLELLEENTDRLIGLQNGRLRYFGTPQNLLGRPELFDPLGIVLPPKMYLTKRLKEIGMENILPMFPRNSFINSG